MESELPGVPILFAIESITIRYKLKNTINPPKEICAYIGYRRHTDWLWATKPERFIATQCFGKDVWQNQKEMRVDPMEHPIWIAISKSIKMRLPLEGGKTTQICENIFHDDQINQQIVRYLTSELQSSEIRLIAAENTEFFE